MKKKVIREYAIHGNVSKVAKVLNDQGIKVGNRKVISNDISTVIMSKPHLNELHVIVQKIFTRNKKECHINQGQKVHRERSNIGYLIFVCVNKVMIANLRFFMGDISYSEQKIILILKTNSNSIQVAEVGEM
ncbi:hypothetical protein M8181_15125 [Bacillus licheniformis]|nr:hypothetical protein M8181_15125 [Bacillus licheniformis]